jgi:hypothetical protein
MRGLLAVVSLLVLCACWNGKDQFRNYMEEGRAGGVPLVVYGISNNDSRHFQGQAVTIAFVNTQDQQIDSVKITVSECDVKASQLPPQNYTFVGPFQPDASFVVAPISLPDAKGQQFRPVNSHMVINSIEVDDASGVRIYAEKDVAKMLDRRIANFCIGEMP